MLIIKLLLENVEPLADLFKRHIAERHNMLIIQGTGESNLHTDRGSMCLRRHQPQHRAKT